MAAEMGDATVASALTTYAGKSTVESGLAPKRKVLDVGVASLSNKASIDPQQYYNLVTHVQVARMILTGHSEKGGNRRALLLKHAAYGADAVADAHFY